MKIGRAEEWKEFAFLLTTNLGNAPLLNLCEVIGSLHGSFDLRCYLQPGYPDIPPQGMSMINIKEQKQQSPIRSPQPRSSLEEIPFNLFSFFGRQCTYMLLNNVLMALFS